jgi:uncharacterized UBP type Zn finger protein
LIVKKVQKEAKMEKNVILTHFINPALSNLCYVNSVATCLVNMDILQAELQILRETSPLSSLLDILLSLGQQSTTIALRDEISRLAFPSDPGLYTRGQQEDAAEFFEHILNQLARQHSTIIDKYVRTSHDIKIIYSYL